MAKKIDDDTVEILLGIGALALAAWGLSKLSKLAGDRHDVREPPLDKSDALKEKASTERAETEADRLCRFCGTPLRYCLCHN